MSLKRNFHFYSSSIFCLLQYTDTNCGEQTGVLYWGLTDNPMKKPEDGEYEVLHAGLMFAAPPGLHPAHAHPVALQSNGLLDHHALLNAAAAASAEQAGQSQSPEQHLAGLNKRAVSPHPTHHRHLDMSPEAKKARVQNSMRILKDEPVPEGYVRFR
jgi:hypothetical protein